MRNAKSFLSIAGMGLLFALAFTSVPPPRAAHAMPPPVSEELAGGPGAAQAPEVELPPEAPKAQQATAPAAQASSDTAAPAAPAAPPPAVAQPLNLSGSLEGFLLSAALVLAVVGLARMFAPGVFAPDPATKVSRFLSRLLALGVGIACGLGSVAPSIGTTDWPGRLAGGVLVAAIAMLGRDSMSGTKASVQALFGTQS